LAINVEEYYKKYGPMVLRRCRTLLSNEDKALDAMQDVFIKLIKKDSDLMDNSPSSLLYRIATNTCLNILRSEKRRPHINNDEILLNVAGKDDHEKRVLTNHFLNRLFEEEKESTRVIAVMHYVDGLTLEETASQIGLSVSGVRKRLRNLRKKGLILKEV
jgi:RNA polymerase sigma-70 factor (ECF subfamily)